MKNLNWTSIQCWIINIGISFCFFAGLVVSYWILNPYNILTSSSHPYVLAQKRYQVGQNVRIRQTYCLDRSTKVEIHRQLVDGQIITLPPIHTTLPEGCVDIVRGSREDANPIKIPQIPSGEYRYVERWIVHVNPIRTKEYKFETEEFLIINKNENGEH